MRSLHVRCEPRVNSGKKQQHNFGVQISLQLQIHYNTRHILKHCTKWDTTVHNRVSFSVLLYSVINTVKFISGPGLSVLACP